MHYSLFTVHLILLIVSQLFHKTNIFLISLLILLANLLISFNETLLLNLDFDVISQGMLVLYSANVLAFSLLRRRIRFKSLIFLSLFVMIQVLALIFIAANFDHFTPIMANTPTIVFGISIVVFLINRLLNSNGYIKLGLMLLVVLGFYFYWYTPQSLTHASLYWVMAGLIGFNLFTGIYRVSYYDQLTGVPSRRSLQEEASKLRGAYSVAMVDIDFFKKFNDRYGHDVGDDVLAFIAGILDKHADGSVFRYGGEEFTILLPKRNLKDAKGHLEELRKLVAESKFTLRKNISNQSKQVGITVSIGVAEKNEKLNSFEQVIKAADKALYRAKNKGRNCVSS